MTARGSMPGMALVLGLVGLVALFIGGHFATAAAVPLLDHAPSFHAFTVSGLHVYVFWGWLHALKLVPSVELLPTYCWGFGSISVAVPCLLVRADGRKRLPRPTDGHGSARLAHDWELFSLLKGRLRSDDRGLVLGQCAGAQLNVVERADVPVLEITTPARWVREPSRHVLVSGVTGDGKDRDVMNTTLLTELSGDSVFVQDPSGNTWKETAGFRALISRCFVLTPARKGGAGFNPVMTVPRNERAIGEAQRIATALVGSVERAKAEGLVYAQAAEVLIQATILDVLYWGESKSLPGVWRSFLGVEPTPDKRGNPSPQREWVRFRSERAPNQAVADVFDQLLGYADQVLAGAFNNALIVLGFCSDPIVADMLERSDFLPDDLRQHDEPLSVYLCIPERDANRLHGLTRVITDTLISGVMIKLERKRGVKFLLNEFVGSGPLPTAAAAFKDIRKYGGMLIPFVQTPSQIEDVYQSQAGGIIGNCLVQLTLGAIDLPSLRNLSVLMGSTTVQDERVMSGKMTTPGRFGANRSSSVAHSEHARALRTEAELRELDPRQAVLLVHRCPPYLVKRVPYYAVPELLKRSQMQPPTMMYPIPHCLPWALRDDGRPAA